MSNRAKHPKKSNFAVGLLRRSTALLASLALVQLSWMPLADAESQLGSSGMTNFLLGQIDTFKNEFVRSQQAAANAARSAALMRQLTPQVQPAKFFPQCRISPARANFPTNLCNRPLRDAAELQMAEGLSTLATQYDGFYRQLLDGAQNSPVPVGIKCLEDAKKNLLSQIEDKKNAMQVMINQITKQNQAFRDQKAALTEKMRDTQAILDGGKNDLNAEKRKAYMAKMLGPSCNDTLADPTLLDGSKGLRNIREALKATALVPATNILRNEKIYKEHLTQQLSRIKDDINARGIDAFLESGISSRIRKGNLTEFKRMASALQTRKEEFNSRKQVIEDELDAVGYKLPAFDQHFRDNVSTFEKDAERFFIKREVTRCVDGSQGYEGLALNTDQIMEGLRHDSRGFSGNTLDTFKRRLREILDRSDVAFEDRMGMIRALEQEYGTGSITITINAHGSGRQTLTPYELYRRTVATCEAKINQNDTYAIDRNTGANAESFREKVTRAKRYLQEALELEREFVDGLLTDIKEEVESCETPAGACQQGPAKIFDPKNQEFCINTAVTCAKKVNTCVDKAQELITNQEQVMEGHAVAYNQLVEGFVAQQEQVLKLLQAQVVRDAEFFKRVIPGSDYKFPEGLFVKMPAMSKQNEFGVMLRGGSPENIEALLTEMPKKLEKLQQMLDGQKQKINGELSQYIAEQKRAMTDNRNDWKRLGNECTAKAGEFRNAVAAQNAEGAKAQGEADRKVLNWCHKYKGLRRSPSGACDKADDLYTDAAEITAYLDPNAIETVSAFQEHCAQVQNDSNESEGNEAPPGPLFSLCENNTWDNVYSQISTDFLGQVPSEMQSDVQAVLNGEKEYGDLGSDFRSSTVGRQLNSILSLKEPEGLRANYQSEFSSRPAELTATISAVRTLQERGENDEQKAIFNSLLEALEADTPDPAAIEAQISAVGTAVAGHSHLGGWASNIEAKVKRFGSDGSLKDLSANHRRLRQRLTDSTEGDLCKKMEERILVNAAQSCASEGYSSTCVDNKVDELRRSPPGQLGRLNSVAKATLSAEPSPLQQIGEMGSDSCEAVASTGRNLINNPFNPAAFDRATLGPSPASTGFDR